MSRRRAPAPWYRKGRDMWFATIDGVQVALDVRGGEGREAALAALAELLARSDECQISCHTAHHRAGSAAANSPIPPPPPLPHPPSSPALSVAVDEFLARVKGRVQPVTYTGYRWMLGQLVAAVGPATPVSALTAERVEASARRATWSSSTRHDYIGAVGVFLRDAGHPLRLRRPPKESRGADALWTESEWLRMLGAARGDFRPLLVVLKETGARPAEAAGLTVEGVDWEHRCARLKAHKTAGKGKVRVLHFPEPAMKVLAEQRRQYQSGPLFLNEESRPFTGLSISRRLALCRARAGIERPITAYGLRHWFCTRALARGASNAQVAALVGNSEAMIAKHYAHIDADAKLLAELAERVSRCG